MGNYNNPNITYTLMDISAYDQVIHSVRDVIFKDYPFAIVRERLLELSAGQNHIAFIDTICSQLSNACLQPMSTIVNRATMVIAELVVNGREEVATRVCQKDFQDCLMHTLRRLTTKLGNLITMHPQVWEEIEARVMNLYSFWYNRFRDEEGKYFHALERYRMLKQLGLVFPPFNPYIKKASLPSAQQSNKVSVSPQLLKDVQELLEWCESNIAKNNTVDLMNTACVRNIKSKSQQLHKIWTTQTLLPSEKELVKNYYGSLRKVSKVIDAENEKEKKQSELNYLDSKKNKIQSCVGPETKPLDSPSKVLESPPKTYESPKKNNLLSKPGSLKQLIQVEPVTIVQNDDLLSEDFGSPSKPFTRLQSSPVKAKEENLLDVGENQDLIPSPIKPPSMEKQLEHVFNSRSQITSSEYLRSPTKSQTISNEILHTPGKMSNHSSSAQLPAPNQVQFQDQFDGFGVASPLKQDPDPVFLIHQEETLSPTRFQGEDSESESPVRLKGSKTATQTNSLIDLI